MADSALFNMSVAAAYAQLNFAGTPTKVYVGAQVYVTTAQQTAWVLGNNGPFEIDTSGSHAEGIFSNGSDFHGDGGYTSSVPLTPDTWHQAEMFWDLGDGTVPVCVDGVSDTDSKGPYGGEHLTDLLIGMFGSPAFAGKGMYIGKVWVGTDIGLHDILLEDWSSGDFSNWTSTSGNCTVVTAPTAPPNFNPGLDTAVSLQGRVFIAFDDGPLKANPTWTVIDQGGSFPVNFVSGFDTKNGRQSLLARTDTGTATVYINDFKDALFDPRNSGSPYFNKLDGRQILLQVYDPFAGAWEPQFRGWIDEASYDIDASAIDRNGDPINASIQLNCVDMFDFLGGYGLTPGLNGDTPPAGALDSVYYAATAGSVDDRIIEVLADVGVNPVRYIVASGNTKVIAVKYSPDEAALTALRDAADAELPFIANIYIDRRGRFVFRGRYSRFDPDTVAAEPGSEWDFTRWSVGDGQAIRSDSTRAQMRVLSYARSRSNIVNAALCYPQDTPGSKIPDQVYADTTSITNYGKHSAPPMTDLLTADYTGPGTITPSTGLKQCALFAELLVKNQKDPREAVSSLEVWSMNAGDARAEATWAFLTKADISHIVNVAVGYPAGTGFTGTSPADDYFIEGRELKVRPANKDFDDVRLSLEVTPAVWSQDTHSVFPPL